MDARTVATLCPRVRDQDLQPPASTLAIANPAFPHFGVEYYHWWGSFLKTAFDATRLFSIGCVDCTPSEG